MTHPVALLTREQLAVEVARLGAEIANDHPNGVVLVGVLKGALLFLADLARAINGIEVQVDFISVSRYAPDSGRVRVLLDVGIDLTGRDVVMVEDLVDTGLTATFLRERLIAKGPRRVSLCTLLDRTSGRIVPIEVKYKGLEIGDVFVLGYGLHAQDLYRNLNAVYAADPLPLQSEPSTYLADLYGPM